MPPFFSHLNSLFFGKPRIGWRTGDGGGVQSICGHTFIYGMAGGASTSQHGCSQRGVAQNTQGHSNKWRKEEKPPPDPLTILGHPPLSHFNLRTS